MEEVNKELNETRNLNFLEKIEISGLVEFFVYLFHICGNNEFANNRANIRIFSG